MNNVLKSFFESFLRSRHMLHHFERWQSLLGSKPVSSGWCAWTARRAA
jgi:Mg2+-importing ATPase